MSSFTCKSYKSHYRQFYKNKVNIYVLMQPANHKHFLNSIKYFIFILSEPQITNKPQPQNQH